MSATPQNLTTVQVAKRNAVQYDPRTGRVTVARQFHIEVDPEEAVSQAFWPPMLEADDTVTIQHKEGNDFSAGGEWGNDEKVELTPVSYDIVRPEKPAYSVVDVTYEGYTWGAIRWEPFMGTTNRIREWGYDETDGYRKGIGPNGAGVPRQFPTFGVRVYFNLTRRGTGAQQGDKGPVVPLEAYTAICSSLCGSVNEADWDPITFPAPFYYKGTWLTWPKSHWLYLGATCEHQRDGTIIFIHRFSFDQNINFYQGAEPNIAHQCIWRHSRRESENVTIDGVVTPRPITKYQKDADAKVTQIYPIAGTNTPTITTYCQSYIQTMTGQNHPGGKFKFSDLMI